VDPVTVSVLIDRPREEVFEYLADISNHAEFCDHFMVDWRLTREDTYGYGAGARDSTIVELEPPRRLVEAGRTGKFNRIRTLGAYTLEQASGGGTRVTFSFRTQPDKPTDRFLESLGARFWVKRKLRKAMRRLQTILEEGRGRGERPTIAGGPRKPATGFRLPQAPTS
jgi:uncharacterized protein YndB with AHSA1/START domain